MGLIGHPVEQANRHRLLLIFGNLKSGSVVKDSSLASKEKFGMTLALLMVVVISNISSADYEKTAVLNINPFFNIFSLMSKRKKKRYHKNKQVGKLMKAGRSVTKRPTNIPKTKTL